MTDPQEIFQTIDSKWFWADFLSAKSTQSVVKLFYEKSNPINYNVWLIIDAVGGNTCTDADRINVETAADSTEYDNECAASTGDMS